MTTVCERGKHRLCGGHQCNCTCHPGTPQERAEKSEKAAVDMLNELAEVVESSGRHDGHTLRQVGRCVYCSCGYRYQGTLPERTKP